jgi:hypothetical protein
MLFRNMQNLYNADATEGTPNPTPDTAQGQNAGATQGEGEKKKPEPITLTPSQLKKRLEDAKAVDRKALLESLGIDSEDSLKALVTAQKAKAEAEKTETQRLQDEIAQLKKERDTEKLQRAEIEKQARLRERDSELKTLLTKAYEPNQVLILMKATHAEKLDALMDENGAFDSDAAKQLVSDYQKENAHLFRDSSPGSSLSTRDGKAPQGNEDARKALENMVAKSKKGF